MNGAATPLLERTLTYVGSIRPPSSNGLRATLCGYVNEQAQKVTILFASDGGSTDDGIALYTFIKTLPLEITMHAIGLVNSIAIPVFCAGKNRLASKNARFYSMIIVGRTDSPQQFHELRFPSLQSCWMRLSNGAARRSRLILSVSLRRAPRRSGYRSGGRSQIRLPPIPRQ